MDVHAGRPGRRKGTPKTGGRKKGTPNKATAAKAAQIAASGQTPLDYLLEVMRNTRNVLSVRVDAAKAAAPYVHPKLQAIEHSLPKPEGSAAEQQGAVFEAARRIASVFAEAINAKKSNGQLQPQPRSTQ